MGPGALRVNMLKRERGEFKKKKGDGFRGQSRGGSRKETVRETPVQRNIMFLQH